MGAEAPPLQINEIHSMLYSVIYSYFLVLKSFYYVTIEVLFHSGWYQPPKFSVLGTGEYFSYASFITLYD